MGLEKEEMNRTPFFIVQKSFVSHTSFREMVHSLKAISCEVISSNEKLTELVESQTVIVGRDSGLVVSMFAFYSDDPSLKTSILVD